MNLPNLKNKVVDMSRVDVRFIQFNKQLTHPS
jgi:hypothetical protein